MSEIRENRLTGEWVIIAPERAKRGGTLASATERVVVPPFLASCMFCAGNEAATADERFRLDGEDGRWVLRSVVNKFSVLSSTGEVARTGCGAPGEVSVNGVGLHEVLIESPRHDVTMALCPVVHVHRILETYRHRFLEFYTDPRVRHVIVFKNHGADAGASQPHPHSQIVGIPIVPGQVVERIERARRFFANSGQCLACTLIAQEREQACRIIAQNAEFVAFIPHAALSPYHLWIFPKTHAACFSNQPVGTLPALAEVLHTVLAKVHGMLANPPFNLVVRSLGPQEKGCGAFSLVHFHCAAGEQDGGLRTGDRDVYQSVVAGILRAGITGVWRRVPMTFTGRSCTLKPELDYPSSLMHSDSLAMSLGNLPFLSKSRTRSVSPENVYGEKGKGGMAELSEEPQPEVAKIGQEWDGPNSRVRDLGRGWKVRPFITVKAGKISTIMDVEGPGIIQQIWMTPTGHWRYSILRIYWDDEDAPSVECPIGDFFACGWGKFAPLVSLAVCVNPGSAFNAYWPMPFRKRCRTTLENIADDDMQLFYQINYALEKVPEEAAYFHAQFRRVNPLHCKEVYTILDGVKGHGHYVGTYMAWGVNNTGWWGEGEIKFFMDGDKEFPTLCGTGTEDYFCGSYNFENTETKRYQEFTTPYAGLSQVIRPDGLYQSQTRFGMYRWHIMDPVRFENDLRVTIQALGWRSGARYLPLQDDIASVAYWYQTEPHTAFPKFPDKDQLEVI